MKKIVSAALLTLAVGGACAQAYMNGNVGVTHLEANCSGAGTCDHNDIGYKIVGGYKLDTHLSVEVGYISFGKAHARVLGSDVDIATQALYGAAALRGNLLPNMTGVARLGVAGVDAKATNALGSSTDSSAKAYLGLGLELAFDKQLKGLLELDFTNSEVANQSGSVRMLSIGLQYNF